MSETEETKTELFSLGKIKMYVSENHRFGTDAFLLAYFSGIHKNDVVCDLCTGCGIIPLIFCKNTPPLRIYAVDIQPEAVSLLEKTVKENALADVIKPVLCDLKDIPESAVPRESCDVVTVNPPYMQNGAGFDRASQAQAIACSEIMCDINDVCRTAKKLLKYGGYLKLCQKPDRLSDVFAAMKENSIEPKSLTFVCNNVNERPWLILVSGKKGAAPGMIVEKPMILRNDDRSYTEEYSKIYE